MEAINPGWFNPTVLGVLLIVLISVIAFAKKALELFGVYMSKEAERQQANDKFFRDGAEQGAARHELELQAWKAMITESIGTNNALVEAFEAHEHRAAEKHSSLLETFKVHEARATERHGALLTSIKAQISQSRERHVEIMELLQSD